MTQVDHRGLCPLEQERSLARTGIPVSSVSEHLGVLRANGLVSTTRTGRFLVHHRTTLGLALAGD